MRDAIFTESMRMTGGLRKPVSWAACQGEIDCILEADLVSRTHEDGFDVGPGAYNRPDDFVRIHQRHRGSPLTVRLPVRAHQTRLGHSQARVIEHETQMSSQTQTARMSKALSVRHQDVGQFLEPIEQRQKHRNLAETQESWHIRERHGHFVTFLAHDLQVRKGNDDDGCRSLFFADTDVDTSNCLDGLPQRLDLQLRSEFTLKLNRFLRCDVPAMSQYNMSAVGKPGIGHNSKQKE